MSTRLRRTLKIMILALIGVMLLNVSWECFAEGEGENAPVYVKDNEIFDIYPSAIYFCEARKGLYAG